MKIFKFLKKRIKNKLSNEHVQNYGKALACVGLAMIL